MAAVTWKNIAPTSGSSVLNSIGQGGELIGSSIAGIGDAFTGYADARTARETDAFKLQLMGASDEQARQALISGADTSFLDLGAVNDANREAGKQARDFADFLSREEFKTENTIKINDAKPDKKVSVSYGKDPLANHFEKQIGEDEGFWSFLGLGSGFDQDDKEEFNQYKSRFLAEYGDKNKYGDRAISGKQYNQFVTDGNVVFEDNPLNDEFTFNHKDKKYNLSDYANSGSQLFDFMSASKGKETESNIDDKLAFAKFSLANPNIAAKDMWGAYSKQKEAGTSK